jgi:hypothetical protein
MRSPTRVLGPAALLLLGGLGLASGAHADKLAFVGVHGVSFAHGASSELVASGPGVATVNAPGGGSGALHTLRLTAPFATFDTTTFPSTSSQISSIRLQNVGIQPTLQGGSFAPIFAAKTTSIPLTRATLPLGGTFRICENATCTMFTQMLPARSPPTMSGTPVGTGVGGAFTLGGAGATRFTLVGAPWTLGTVTVVTSTTGGMNGKLTAMGSVGGPGTGTMTTLPSGMVQLVTATQVTASGIRIKKTGFVSRLTIQFSPEPSLLLLLGSGALGMALLGRKRVRH